jgi:hypothetical protein
MQNDYFARWFDLSPCQVGGNRRYDHAPAPGAPLYWRTSEIKVAWTPRSLIKSAAETTIRLVFSKGRELALPVVGAVVSGVGAGGVLHDDGITGAEVVEEPPCVGGADVDAAMADVAIALVIH